MSGFTLHDLQCFDAVVRAGGFQAAAALLHRTHPAVFAAIARLEQRLGLSLLDRSGYRVQPTEVGRSFHRRVQPLLHEMENLRAYAAQLAIGEESELSVVIGDLCPRPQTLTMLSRFFAGAPRTRLQLYYESVTGPWERLFDNDADLIVHRVDKSDPRLEWIDLCKVHMVPVVAPGFLPFAVSKSITPEQMRELTQCIMRDSAQRPPQSNSYFVIEGAHQCTVGDQLTKKEIILQGMGWGHLPRFLIEEELRDGRLVSIAGTCMPGRAEELVVARRRDRPHGPVAKRLWEFIKEEAANLREVVEGRAVATRATRRQVRAPGASPEQPVAEREKPRRKSRKARVASR